MAHWIQIGAPLVCAALLTGCGGVDQARQDSQNPLLDSVTRPEPIMATGCLTAADGQFIVTSLDSTAAVPTTIAYRLQGGNEQELQQHVNRKVRVAGEADPAQVADVRSIPTPAVGTSGRGGEDVKGVDPQVKTQEAMRFEVRSLKVLSVTPTGDPCPAGAAQNP